MTLVITSHVPNPGQGPGQECSETITVAQDELTVVDVSANSVMALVERGTGRRKLHLFTLH